MIHSMLVRRVQVYARTKPTSQFADSLLELDSASRTVRVHLPPHPTRGHIDNQQLDFSFSIDGVLHNATQEEVCLLYWIFIHLS